MPTHQPTLVVVGTRPDAIKLAPVIHELRRRAESVFVLSSGQHRELFEPLEELLDLRVDRTLDVMREGSSLERLHRLVLAGVDEVCTALEPSRVIVQGDTTTAFSAALAAYYRQIPVAHVEAGLRTRVLHRPWPEEFHRQSIARLATWHFAPTERAAQHLREESVGGSVHVVGNTVVDALAWLGEHRPSPVDLPVGDRPYVLVTCHRREQASDSFVKAVSTIRRVAQGRPDLDFLYPVHPNPVVRGAVEAGLAAVDNVRAVEPLRYDAFVSAMRGAQAVLTDSGGVQEEAAALGRPVLVMRDETDRPEALDAGAAAVVGFDHEAILARLDDPPSGDGRQAFGDGRAASRIADVLGAGQN
jgi:UDP-N-acetylglucosamine 2-epimerase